MLGYLAILCLLAVSVSGRSLTGTINTTACEEVVGDIEDILDFVNGTALYGLIDKVDEIVDAIDECSDDSILERLICILGQVDDIKDVLLDVVDDVDDFESQLEDLVDELKLDGALCVGGTDLQHKKNQKALGIYGINFDSCEDAVEDVKGIVSFAQSSAAEVRELISDITAVLAKVDTCKSDSIFDQITCYLGVLKEAKEAVVEAKADIEDLLPELQSRVSQLKTDAMSCIGKSASTKLVKSSSSCGAVIGDVEDIASLLKSSAGEVEGLVSKAEKILAKYNKCSTESIFKQIACYESVITEAKAMITTAKTDLTDLEAELQPLVNTLQSDVQGCVGKQTVSSKVGLGINVNSCEAAVGDVKDIALLVKSSSGEVTTLVQEVEDILAKYNKCSTESIFKQITCYESVINEAKAAITSAKADIAEIYPKVMSLVQVLQGDIQKCIA